MEGLRRGCLSVKGLEFKASGFKGSTEGIMRGVLL